MIFAAVYGFLLLFVIVLIFVVFLTIIYFSKNKVLAELIICGFILFFTINFFYIWFPIKENMELKIANYLLITEYNGAVPEVSFSLGDKGYLKKLNKIKDNWIGYIYDFDEAISKFLDEEKIGKEKIEYNKNSGYFIINSQNQLFHLTEEQVKEKLKVKKLNLKNPEKIIRKYGEKKEKSTFYKIIDDYFIPFSDKGISGTERLTFIKIIFIVILLGYVVVAVFLLFNFKIVIENNEIFLRKIHISMENIESASVKIMRVNSSKVDKFLEIITKDKKKIQIRLNINNELLFLKLIQNQIGEKMDIQSI